MFRKMPFILVLVILGVLIVNPYLAISAKQALYSLSLAIKSLIVFLLPIIIFCLLFKAVVNLAGQASSIILMVLVLVVGSNFISTFISQFVGVFIYQFDLTVTLPEQNSMLAPLWSFELPKVITNDKAMFLSIVMGFVASRFWPKLASAVALNMEKIVAILLRSFVYIIPVFVTGFIVKLEHDGVVYKIMKDYTGVFAAIAVSQYLYILLLYFVLSGAGTRKFLASLRNMLPAAISGLSTMSSAASMPLTIIGVEKNCKNKGLASTTIPVTVNIHLVGDCFAIPIFAFAVLKSFGIAEPSLMTYLIFTFYFVIAKFSVAAVPGGGIIVMIPILESYLGFTPDMLSLITALYILFDPVITSANVLGNGAFAMVVDCVNSRKVGRGSNIPKPKEIERASVLMPNHKI